MISSETLATFKKKKKPSFEMEKLEIIAVDEGISWGTSLFMNLLGERSVIKCKFIARVFSPSRTRDAAYHAFAKPIGVAIENLEGEDRREAKKALDWLHQEVIGAGWKQIGTGVHWYCYKYERPYPFDIDFFIEQAGNIYQSGDYESALEAYNFVIQYWPNNDLSYCYKSQALQKLGRHNEALKAINLAIQVREGNNEDADFYYQERNGILQDIKSDK